MWNIIHLKRTRSTNEDARAGKPGDVFLADVQTAGRGRLDHTWHSAPRQSVAMSEVIDVSQIGVAQAATLPLVAGLAAAEAIQSFLPNTRILLKWPNDVVSQLGKICGILCERTADRVICGIGVNVREKEFPNDIAHRAASMAMLGADCSPREVAEAILAALARNLDVWREGGLAPLLPRIAAIDALRGKRISILRTDGDTAPFSGVAEGIAEDGAIIVSGERIYAGEAHILA